MLFCRTRTGFYIIGIVLLAVGICFLIQMNQSGHLRKMEQAVEVTAEGSYIKWVDFKVSYEALCEAYELDVASCQEKEHIDWVKLLAYVGAGNGGEFSKGSVAELQKAAKRVKEEQITLEEMAKDREYYDYYEEAYRAVLGGMVGEFSIQCKGEKGELVWKNYYGLKAFSPIAQGFYYTDYDDFGSSRSFGYKRRHLGHDMMGQIGTPIIAIESGYVEAIGWNQYGGWRIGIRSLDKKRYYYYAHLRQNYPYAEGLEEGSLVTAGDVIGYMGHTGYSTKENTNNIKTVHLHWGLQLIFDESQKEGNNEIWVDCYALTRFLYRNKSEAAKRGESREWKRVYEMRDPLVESLR